MKTYSEGPPRIGVSQSQDVENEVNQTSEIRWTSWSHMRDSNQILSGLWEISLCLRIRRDLATAPSDYNESICLQYSGKTCFWKPTRCLGQTLHTNLGCDRKGDVLEELWFQSKSSEIACSSVGIVYKVKQSHNSPRCPEGSRKLGSQIT